MKYLKVSFKRMAEFIETITDSNNTHYNRNISMCVDII